MNDFIQKSSLFFTFNKFDKKNIQLTDIHFQKFANPSITISGKPGGSSGDSSRGSLILNDIEHEWKTYLQEIHVLDDEHKKLPPQSSKVNQNSANKSETEAWAKENIQNQKAVEDAYKKVVETRLKLEYSLTSDIQDEEKFETAKRNLNDALHNWSVGFKTLEKKIQDKKKGDWEKVKHGLNEAPSDAQPD